MHKRFKFYRISRNSKLKNFPLSHIPCGVDLAIGLDLGTNKSPPLKGESLLSPILFSWLDPTHRHAPTLRTSSSSTSLHPWTGTHSILTASTPTSEWAPWYQKQQSANHTGKHLVPIRTKVEKIRHEINNRRVDINTARDWPAGARARSLNRASRRKRATGAPTSETFFHELDANEFYQQADNQCAVHMYARFLTHWPARQAILT